LNLERETSYRAPAWLPGGHAQTVYAALLAPRPRVRYRRERWDTPDGDFIELDRVVNPALEQRRINLMEPATVPLVVLFHGLEGSSHSHYALALMAEVSRRGWRGAVVHFRGCGGEPNRLPRAYHSGDSAEAEWILRRVAAGQAGAPVYAAGVSLGGNVLLKWLGETGADARVIVQKAAAVSAPVDLMAAGEALDRGFNLIYRRHFLATMRKKALEKLKHYPELYDAARVRAAYTLREFDDLVTAPVHGFAGVDDYWTRASSKPWLRYIAVPTLMINARNDPFLPCGAMPAPHEVNPSVLIEQPESGGHVGFVSGPFPGSLSWLPHRILEFFSA
jgi:hypothetical protein